MFLYQLWQYISTPILLTAFNTASALQVCGFRDLRHMAKGLNSSEVQFWMLFFRPHVSLSLLIWEDGTYGPRHGSGICNNHSIKRGGQADCHSPSSLLTCEFPDLTSSGMRWLIYNRAAAPFSSYRGTSALSPCWNDWRMASHLLPVAFNDTAVNCFYEFCGHKEISIPIFPRLFPVFAPAV